jgi:hypothetical protein
MRNTTERFVRLFTRSVGFAALLAVMLPAAVLAEAPPSPWQTSDIGNPSLPGNAAQAGGVFTVVGAGRGVTARADQFTFTFQQLAGDGTITARVDAVQSGSSKAEAGLMIRESLAAGAPHAFLNVGGAGQGLSFRLSAGGRTYRTGQSFTGTPIWLRLQRRGATIVASRSADGVSWAPAGSVTLSMRQTVYVGLAVSSRDVTQRATATFTNVSDGTSSPTNQPPSISLTSPASGSTHTNPASMTLAANATDVDGTIAEVSFYNGATLLGTDTTSPYSYTWTTTSGGSHELSAMARDNMGLVTKSAVATVTVAAAANRPPTVSLTAPTGGANYTAPASINLAAHATDTDGSIASVSFYEGANLLGTVTASPYTFNWSGVRAGTYSLTAMARDNAGMSTTSAVVAVTVTPAVNQPPTVSLSTPAGPFTVGTPIVLSAIAVDPDGTVKLVEFYANGVHVGPVSTPPYSVTWTPTAAGSYSLRALAYDQAMLSNWSAAVAVTVAPAANRPPTVALTAPVNGTSFTAPASIALMATAHDPDGTIVDVTFRAGAMVFTDTTVSYGHTWTNVPAGTYSVTAVARDNAGTTTTSPAVTVTVTAAANQPPSVTLTAPANGSTHTALTAIHITADASDSGGSVTQVEFYAGGTHLGTDTTFPYAVTWDRVPAGQYSLTAVARDDNGGTTVSSARTITVNDAALPSVAAFVPSMDHDNLVERYVIDFYPSNADPATANPVASQDVGKPAVVGGECRADVAQTIASLPPGSYVATVTAVAGTEASRSEPSPVFLR